MTFEQLMSEELQEIENIRKENTFFLILGIIFYLILLASRQIIFSNFLDFLINIIIIIATLLSFHYVLKRKEKKPLPVLVSIEFNQWLYEKDERLPHNLEKEIVLTKLNDLGYSFKLKEKEIIFSKNQNKIFRIGA